MKFLTCSFSPQQTWLANQIVKVHNQLRNKVAGGGHGQPRAANMRKLKWNVDLATRAQE